VRYGLSVGPGIAPPSSARARRFRTAVAAAACALVVSACGSAGATNGSGSQPGFLAFSECMRSHGVPDFPDPSPAGGIHLSSGMDPSSPAFRAARGTCQKLLPGGGPGNAHPTEQAKLQMLRTSQCMRRHGISGFPDPTLSVPSDPSGYSAVLDRGGVVIAIPDTISTRSPAFNQAAVACGFGVGLHP
jgi:hypothetical protein